MRDFAIFGAAKALCTILAVFLDTNLARSLAVVRRYGSVVLQWVVRVFNLAAFVISIEAMLRFFTVKDNVVGAVTDFLTAPIREGRVDFSLWDIIAFGLVLTAAILISRGVRLLLEEDVFPRMRLGRGIPVMITTTVYYAILLFGFFFAWAWREWISIASRCWPAPSASVSVSACKISSTIFFQG